MKKRTVTREMDMVDSLGYIRHVTVTIESDPGIQICASVTGYYDEDGFYHDFIGRREKERLDLERIDISSMKKVTA